MEEEWNHVLHLHHVQATRMWSCSQHSEWCTSHLLLHLIKIFHYFRLSRTWQTCQTPGSKHFSGCAWFVIFSMILLHIVTDLLGETGQLTPPGMLLSLVSPGVDENTAVWVDGHSCLHVTQTLEVVLDGDGLKLWERVCALESRIIL